MTDLFKNKYRIASSRLKNWDYSSSAAYFVTICTKDMECFFGEVVGGKTDTKTLRAETLRATSLPEGGAYVELTKVGKIAFDFWQQIPQHFPFVKLDVFVVMPNHIHGILILRKSNVETLHATSHHATSQKTLGNQSPVDLKNHQMAAISPKTGSLSTVIRSYKSAVTKSAKENIPHFQWQAKFYEHVIRDADSYERIQNYIINNPANWSTDRFFKA